MQWRLDCDVTGNSIAFLAFPDGQRVGPHQSLQHHVLS